ncbi:MAG: ImmA/IrrE family metallo-endopeptidase [Chloroflexi bacterium]|nr:ImmA/IrrE family metallo-endopeptidase [Chloroflexota bacterium]
MQQHVLESIDPKLLGRRLQVARKARGLRQEDVAEALGAARTTITAIEKGERRVQPAELITLAALYGRAVSDFVGKREAVEDFAAQFRGTLTHPNQEQVQADLAQGVQDFQRLCEDYAFLDQVNEAALPRAYPPQYPVEGVSPEGAAEDVASAERNRLGLGEGPVLNLREVLENDVGLRIFFLPLPSRVAGIFAYTELLGGCIAVNTAHPEERRRWTMAHEYGHFLTNRFRPEISILAAYERIPPAEGFADAFAGVFLMPTSGLRRRFNESTRLTNGKVTAADICRLADYYFVSVEAMMRRLEELRLLASGTWERLKDRGFKVRAARELLGLVARAHPDHLLPIRYRLLAVRAYQESKLTEGELAKLLRVDREQARRTVQETTQQMYVSGEGEVESLSVDLASTVAGQES